MLFQRLFPPKSIIRLQSLFCWHLASQSLRTWGAWAQNLETIFETLDKNRQKTLVERIVNEKNHIKLSNQPTALYTRTNFLLTPSRRTFTLRLPDFLARKTHEMLSVEMPKDIHQKDCSMYTHHHPSSSAVASSQRFSTHHNHHLAMICSSPSTIISQILRNHLP